MKEAQTQRQEHLENISQKCETALYSGIPCPGIPGRFWFALSCPSPP